MSSNTILPRLVAAWALGLPVALLHADTLISEPPTALTNAHHGAAVAIVGDIDFDGYADMIVGTPGASAGGVSAAGRIVIRSGKTGVLLREQWSHQPAANGHYGAALVGLPDLDGDGRSEYAVGAPGESGGVGAVHVYSGASGVRIWSGSGLPGTKGFGGCLAVVPDCTGDAVVELVVGNGGDHTDQTYARIYHANSGLSWKLLNRPQTEEPGVAFGHAVGGIPDVTGDGRGDVVVGAPLWNGGTVDRGAAWIYDGATGALVRELATPDPEMFGRFGHAVAGIGDLDGDGRGEVIVGAPGEDAGMASDGAGRAYVFSGATGEVIHALIPPNNWTGGHFGARICVAANFDDDGVPDFVVASPDAGSNGGGWVHRFSGATGEPIGGLISSIAGRAFGDSISAAGDCTQDGRSDLLIGAPRTEVNGFSEVGRAELRRLVINDGCSPSSEPLPITVGSTYFSNVGATNFTLVESPCGGTDPQLLNSDVHFTFTPPANGILQISACGTTFDNWIALYRGCEYTQFGCVWGPPEECNDDAPGCANGGAAVAMQVTAGECVRIRVGGIGEEQGIASLLVHFDAVTCWGDLDGDGAVAGGDLGFLLAAWGGDGPADLDNSGTVDGADLGLLLSAWGTCVVH